MLTWREGQNESHYHNSYPQLKMLQRAPPMSKGQHVLYTRLGTSTYACIPFYTPGTPTAHTLTHTHTYTPQPHPAVLFSSVRFNFALRTPSPHQT